jgi:peptidoglycan/xylan/chitin deacetylase (PgdA/CDA1 family)
MKLLCFRFDVDTALCASKGVPNLVNLANSLGVKFTFFFNMGRAVSRTAYLKKRWQKMPHTSLTDGKVIKLSSLKKLGLFQFILTALFNPYVGRAYMGNILFAHQKGHEIGLHGGRNHGEWQNNSQNWTEARFREELEFGLAMLHRAGIEHVTAFSSPGWQGPQGLHPVLNSLGFKSVADMHGHDLNEITRIGPELISIPTNIVGEPGGVGYIEHLRAKGLNHQDIITHFQETLMRQNQFAVVYDHPYYAGIRELDLIEKMIIIAHEMDYSIVTIKEIVSTLAK